VFHLAAAAEEAGAVVVALVGGGARSGKSRFAQEYAERRFERPALVATAQALDEEMAQRIARHRSERSGRWGTIEEPVEIVAAMAREADRYDGFVVDCLTLWLSNVMPPEDGIERLVQGLAGGPPVVLVTNEVGCGIVPDNELARRFRDLAGILNRRCAAVAQEVYWMAFGIPVRVK
jgi:adenosylcobinamide kinase / adenosylcobinamide-phosphate guanylyltransferase